MTTAGADVPIEALYPFAAAGDDIELFTGELRVAGHVGAGRVWVQMTGDVRYRWRLDEEPWPSLILGDVVVAFEHPTLGPVQLSGRVTSSAGRGILDSQVLGSAEAVDYVQLQWANIPWVLPAEALRTAGAVWSGRWSTIGAGWTVVLDVRVDLPKQNEAARHLPSHLLTHTGELRRTDRTPFTLDEALDAIEAVHVALSFALGRWVSPVAAAGIRDGRQRWLAWRQWRCDVVSGQGSWWDTHRGDDLEKVVAEFLTSWADPASRDVVRLVAHHVIEANTPGTTVEARIMLVSAALEYLSWATYVLTDQRSARSHKEGNAETHLRELLEAADIPSALPPELPAAVELARTQRRSDGPAVVSWLRNRLVHPKNASEPYELEHLVLEAWLLLMQYAELLLLHRCGYRGAHLPRYPTGGWAHDSKPVPWTKG